MSLVTRLPLLVCIGALPLSLAAQTETKTADAAPAKVDYFRQVRPILTQHCYGCHGPDEGERSTDMRFDQKETLFVDLGDGRPTITPGDPAASEMILRITHKDVSERMPPEEANDELTKAQIDLLTRWVEEGAVITDHWAFEAPSKPEVPTAEGWSEQEIDRFVAAHHRVAGVKASPRADKVALIRRLSFDLTGLPPTPEEVEDFVDDKSDKAYETVVDRLLASERYGERQAQDWLDLARYADSNGYQRDGEREAWKWREWVIHAFNENKPYDEFAIEQLAGDLLEDPTLEQQIATGFNRNHPTNSEAGEEPDEYRTQYVMDRVNTTATTFLGLTVACAQCHDHKFDPISQKDYYRFYAFFDQVEEKDNGGFGGGRNAKPKIRVPNPDQAPHMADLKRRIEELEKHIEKDNPIADAAQPAWEEKARELVGDDVAWQAADPIGMIAHQGSILRLQDDSSILATGEPPVRDTYDLTFKPGKRKISGIKIEVLPSSDEDGAMTGRSRKGQFILSGLKLRLSSLSDSQDPPLVFVAKAEADLKQKRPEDPGPDPIFPGDIAGSIIADDSKKASGGGRFFSRGWSIIGDERMEEHEALLVPLETLDLNDSSILHVSMQQNAQPYKSLIGRFRISFTSDDRVRDVALPAIGKRWHSVGPFPAKDAAAAFATAFEPEKKRKDGIDLKASYEQPVVEKESKDKKSDGKSAAGKSATEKGPQKPSAPKSGKPAEKSAKPKPDAGDAKPAGKPAVASEAARDKPDAKKPGGKGKFAGKAKGKSDGAKKEAVAKAGKPDAAGKPSAKPEGKPKPDQAKPSKPSAKPGAKPDEKAKPKRKPQKLEWKKQHTWRDGRRATLDDGDVAWYLTRKIHSTKARTVTMRFDGPPGVKAWLNGEEIFRTSAPSNESSRGSSRSRGRSRGGDSSDREVTVGLREGESELLVKATFKKRASRRGSRGSSGGEGGGAGFGFNPEEFGGEFDPSMFGNLSDEEIAEFYQSRRQRSGGGSFTFSMTPHGADVLTYEVVAALRELDTMQIANAVEASAKKGGPSEPDATDGKTEEEVAARIAKLQSKVRKFYRENIDTVGKILFAEKEKLERELRTLERKMPEALVMKDLEKDKMRQTHLFIRGEYKNKGEKVEAGVPSVLPAMPEDLPQNRLGLAKWLVDPKNPLTSRVLVNRVWQQYFGRGLVTTPDDFGLRSDAPSHPKLLDWLACDLMENGWDLKRLHKQIVMSETYRQSSKVDAQALENDPDNALLARAPRKRLSAEMIRDNALAASGLLVQKLGGKSIKPYQPKGLWEEVSKGMRYRRDKGDDQYRRGLYVFWKRGAPYPSMSTFDSPKREVCVVERAQTTTPLQALVLLNDPVFVEAAKMLGQRLREKSADDDEARLRFGFELCASRAPEEAEVAALSELLKQQRKIYGDDTEAAKKLLDVGDKKVEAGDDELAEAAAWTAVGSALLNMDATIHR